VSQVFRCRGQAGHYTACGTALGGGGKLFLVVIVIVYVIVVHLPNEQTKHNCTTDAA
jgi:hypothetical protein